MTEYGAQALPNVDTLQQMFDANVLFPKNDADLAVWKFADFQPKETAENGVKMGNSIEEFIRNSQRYQAQVIRFGTETFRRGKYEKSTGIYHFMFVDDSNEEYLAHWPCVRLWPTVLNLLIAIHGIRARNL